MNQKKFNFWHRLGALLALAVSAVTYLLTIEPSASYWDCGEFIASSYKLEVGHPPGNPMFQLIARFFTLFGDSSHAAVLVNVMSALCSALTIFFLYLTIVWFAKRLTRPSESGEYSLARTISLIGSGLVGSLVYCFSDTFWFSAVEGEVYAMSSLVTAIVFWAMTMWYDHADESGSNRWIVLIAFVMGLSIGIHVLNLLAIPAIVFMYWYRMREDRKMTFAEFIKVFLIGVLILGFLYFLVIPWLPKLAAYFDLFFVNTLGLPYNTGAAFFLLLLLALCFWGLFSTLRKQKVFLNTSLLCFTVIVIGFSVFSIDIIRSCAKTPTNEYQPDNAFTLVRYLSREQYGKNPIIYGQYFDAPYDLKSEKYWAPLDGRYKLVDGPVDAEYKSSGKMLFPRMWSPGAGDDTYQKFYQSYTDGKGKKVSGATYRKPTMGANLYYFFDYQLNWMYWRYFMWNFVGRQNEIHSPSPGDIFHGNWESGIGFLDSIRLGDQSDAPATLAENKGKNHYFFLPLLLGLLGLFFQFDRDRRGCWLNFLMFFMTGIAIVIYLNQPPFQVRERDYAYAGSFYFFSVWAGLGVVAMVKLLTSRSVGKSAAVTAAAVSLLCLSVPVEMAAQNWDDHDRSNRRTAVEMASNYLNSVGENGILVTHGDNDTFPLWYSQEVEGIRTDVRICNTSLLGTDWHIDQMRWAVNESSPLPISVSHKQYLYGTNEYIPIYDTRDQAMSISDVMKLFRHPDVKLSMSSGRKVDYIASRKIVIPVNRENCVRSGIVSGKYADNIPESITIQIPRGKEYLSKPELFMLDLLSNYQWDRPLHLLNMGGDLNIGIKDYLEYVGYSYKVVPFRSQTSSTKVGFCDSDELYDMMTRVYKFDAVSADDYFIDYQNLYTHLGVMSVRGVFFNAYQVFKREGQNDRALEMLDRGVETMRHYPIESVPVGLTGNDLIVAEMTEAYYDLGQKEKADALGSELAAELLKAAQFYIEFYDYAKDDFEVVANYIFYLSDIFKKGGSENLSKSLDSTLTELVKLGQS